MFTAHLSYGENFFGACVKTKSDERAALFSRHLPEGWSLQDELALFAVQPSAKQQTVEQRLRTIDSYLDGSSELRGSVDAASAALGVGRRQFFKLITKLRQLGPTRGLTPGFRNVERRSIASDGLTEPLESLVQEMMVSNPGERISKIAAAVREKCEEIAMPFPGESAIRRRVHALRRLLPAKKVSAAIGAQLTADQVHLDLAVRDRGEDRYAILTLIIDQQTKLILGHGVTGDYGISGEGEGLRLALEDFESHIPVFAGANVPIAPRLQELTLIAPHELEFASQWLTAEIPTNMKPVLTVVDSGSRRHGAAILRHIGDRLPPFSFMPMAMERLGAASPHEGIPIDAARRLVRSSVDRWNERFLSPDLRARGQRIARLNCLKQLARDLRTLTDPLYEAVESVREMFNEAQAE